MHLNLHRLALPVRLATEQPMTDDELIRFSRANRPLRIEQESNGDLLIMSPTGNEGSAANAELVLELGLWARQDGRGRVFESNAGFRLPNGSVRSPDASWVSWARWNALSKEEQERFGPLCPEFVVELQSRSDRTTVLQAKMAMWISQGAELAWLIDPKRKVVEMYRPERKPEVLEGLTAVYGEGPVSGFVLELARIWG